MNKREINGSGHNAQRPNSLCGVDIGEIVHCEMGTDEIAACEEGKVDIGKCDVGKRRYRKM